MNIILFFTKYVIQILLTLPEFYYTCRTYSHTLQTYSLYFIHHALDIFLFWSFLFLETKLEYIIHFILSIIVGLHWFWYDNRCIATVVMNRYCNYDENRWLDSTKNMLGLRKYNEYFHFIWVGLLMAYDLYKILG